MDTLVKDIGVSLWEVKVTYPRKLIELVREIPCDDGCRFNDSPCYLNSLFQKTAKHGEFCDAEPKGKNNNETYRFWDEIWARTFIEKVRDMFDRCSSKKYQMFQEFHGESPRMGADPSFDLLKEAIEKGKETVVGLPYSIVLEVCVKGKIGKKK